MARLYRRPDTPGGTYYLDYFKLGKRVRCSLDTDVLKEAKLRRDAIMAGEAEQRWGRRDKDCTPADFWNLHETDPAQDTGAYITWARDYKRKSSIERERICWAQFLDAVHPDTLGAVTERDVQKFLRYLQRPRKARMRNDKSRTIPAMGNRTINDVMRRMRMLYGAAVDRKIYQLGNPFADFEKLPTETKPIRWLSDEQSEALLTHAEKHSPAIHLFVALATFAGLRALEAVNCKWTWIDFTHGTLTVQAADDGTFSTKGKRYRTIPLNARLQAILAKYRKADGYVINPDRTEPGKWRMRYEPRTAFTTIAKAAGVPWATPHTLRHSFASRLAQSGVSLFKVSRWLGHRSVTTTEEFYAELAPRDNDIDRL